MGALVDTLHVTDPISGVEAPVAVRTLGASGRQPIFILLGDRPATTDDPPAARDADAMKLFWALRDGLPWPTYYNILRRMLIEGSKRDFFGDTRTPEVGAAIETLLTALDKELGIYGGAKPASPVEVHGPITKPEIAETLGWDSVPGETDAKPQPAEQYNANALIPGAPPSVLDIRD